MTLISNVGGCDVGIGRIGLAYGNDLARAVGNVGIGVYQ